MSEKFAFLRNCKLTCEFSRVYEKFKGFLINKNMENGIPLSRKKFLSTVLLMFAKV